VLEAENILQTAQIHQPRDEENLTNAQEEEHLKLHQATPGAPMNTQQALGHSHMVELQRAGSHDRKSRDPGQVAAPESIPQPASLKESLIEESLIEPHDNNKSFSRAGAEQQKAILGSPYLKRRRAGAAFDPAAISS